jgi:16S rRNA (cytosine967-C5)-methyltransferase
MTAPTSARELVAQVLKQQAARFPEIEPIDLDTSSLDTRDAALAHALYDASIRRWLTLEYLIQQGLNRPFRELEPALQAILILGAAQLLLLDRIPPHAALDQSVEWAKRTLRPGAGNLVNAVLRRVSSSIGDRIGPWHNDRRSIPLASGSRELIGIKLPENERDRLAIATSVPMMLIDRWANDHNRTTISNACLHSLANPPTVLNVSFLESPLPVDSTSPHNCEGHALWVGQRDELGPLLLSRRDVWAQDSSSAEAIRSIADQKPKRIIDLCAGQGTKTRQLRATFPGATIAATDVDQTRYATLSEVFEGDDRVQVRSMAEVHHAERGMADLVLLDVPCSNTGVMGRRVESRYRSTPSALKRLKSIQRQIIQDALPLLSKNGSILYATCSLDHAENQSQMIWADKSLGMSVSRERSSLPITRGNPESSVDGSYSALLTPASSESA